MKSNFEFLKEYWPALAQIGETAENYLYSDSNACIYKIGLFTEQEKRIEELTKQLKVAVTTVSGTTQKERAKPSERVSAMMNWTEAQTRYTIWNHRVNVQAGWKNF